MGYATSTGSCAPLQTLLHVRLAAEGVAAAVIAADPNSGTSQLKRALAFATAAY